MSDYNKSTNFTAKDTLPTGNSGKIVKGTEIDTELNAVANAIASKADINSPNFTGTPTASTPSSGTNTTQIATTAFVTGAFTTSLTASATLTNKTLDLANNTITGTLAQFNTACSNADFASIAGAETLTNKTLTNPTVTTGSFANPALTGVPTAPTATAGTNTTQIATTAFVTAALSAAYPVGSIYVNASVSTNPATLLGFGTWEAFGAGRVMIGFNASDTLFDTLEETGGSKDAVVVSHTHTATTTATDSGHTHSVPLIQQVGTFGSQLHGAWNGGSTTTTTGTANITASTTVASTGSSGTNANLQPYITVRMWKRTA
jgi:hypothetical protein